jgi:fibronectin type 3 domain-containing protein
MSVDAVASTCKGPQPSICTRSCWGARASSTSYMSALSRAIIHHTAGQGDYTTDYEVGKAKVRGVQNYHMDANGWSDIGYHFLFNAGGHIYEGRIGSMASLPRGAHDACNADSFGFTALGYYHTPYNQSFTSAQQDAMYRTIAWRMPAGWSPYGSGTYCGVTVGRLDGHRKVKATACPGDIIWAHIGSDYNGGNARNGVASRRSCGAVNNAAVVGVSAPSSVSAGSSFSATITMNNNGTTTWTADGTPHGLGSQAPQDNTTWGTTRVALPGNIGPGGNCAFTRTFTAPATPGTYAFDWKMVEDGVQWFGATATHTITVTEPVTNPPYYFGSSAEGWVAGNASTGLTWTDCCGWPGVIYADQNGADAFWIGPNAGFGGVADTSVNVSVFPQSGTTGNHDMQLFWRTAAENFYDATKATPIVTYTAQDAWINLNLNASSAKWSGQTIKGLRLDFDNNNSATRWIVNHVISQVTPKYWFGTSASGWVSGNGLTGINWISDGTWPGCIYADQTANDAYFISPGISFIGAKNDRFRVNVYPQNGSTANHDMQIFWATSAENFFSADKSSPVVNYTAQNSWADLTLDVGSNPKWSGHTITQIRLDLDQANSGVRWIVDYAVVSHLTDIVTITPPAAPSGLSASAVSTTQVNLSWTDNSNNEDNFIVSRSTTPGGSYTTVATLGANATSHGDSGLTGNTTYYYVVRAVNTGGSSANSNEASVTTPNGAPLAPSGLAASAVGSSQINLSWNDNSSNEDSFIVARSATAGGPYSDVANLAANTTSYSDTGRSPATTYYYVIRAVNAGGSSPNSNEAGATTLPTPPTAPSGLAGTAASSSQINLSWADNSSNEANFIVARSTTVGGPYTDIATLGANVTSYNNTGLAADTTYYYVVRASNTGGTSANSNEANARTLKVAPAAASGLAATAFDSTRIDLTWVDNSSNEDNFIVRRSTSSGGPFSDVATLGANATSFSETGLSQSTTYYYVIRAVNNGGSADSAQASATTPMGVFIIDNTIANVVGTWSTGSSATDKFGADYRFRGQGTGANYVQFTPNIATAGNYEVYEWHPQGANRTVGAPHVITHSGGASTVNVNQQINGGRWNLIGTFNFAAGTAGNVRINDTFADAGMSLMADAIKIVYIAAPTAPSGLAAVGASTSQINLSWTDNSSNEDGFIIARSTSPGGPFTDIATVGANVTSYSNTGLAEGVIYYYQVRASLLGVNSGVSNTAGARTLVNDIIIDNAAATVTGSWLTGTSALDKYGADYRHKGKGTGAAFLTFTPNVVAGGNYRVYEWHPQGSNRTVGAPVTVTYNGGTQTVNVNQTINGGTWVLVGTYNFAAGTSGSIKISDAFADTEAGKVVMADAIKLEFVP